MWKIKSWKITKKEKRIKGERIIGNKRKLLEPKTHTNEN